jgi:hypothetical protein
VGGRRADHGHLAAAIAFRAAAVHATGEAVAGAEHTSCFAAPDSEPRVARIGAAGLFSHDDRSDGHAMEHATDDEVTEPTLWKKAGWIAKVIKNEDDEGWAVEMTRIGDSEPALVGHWTMGRDKRNPKPLDAGAFATLVKTASEVLRRHEQAARERLHRTLAFATDQGQRVRVELDVCPDDDDPHAILVVFDEATDEELRSGRVTAGMKLTAATVQRFLRTGEG